MPRSKATTRPPGTAEIQVARRLAALRAENGLTLRDVAQRSGLSDAYLNRVERQKTPINIANLEKVASAFGVPLSIFFETNTSQDPLVITRKGDGKKVRFRGRTGFRTEMLADQKKGKLMEPILVDLASAKAPVPLQSHPGQEFNYIIEGRCLFYFGKHQIELSTGDSIYFDASVPHVCRAIDKMPARMIAVVSSSTYPLHGDISILLDDP